MAKDPAVLFYTSDFLTGCALMSMAQRGKYITLLCLQHQQGHLSEEDMLDVCGAHDPKIWKKFKQDEDGLYYNERMDQESNKRKKFVESRQNNLKKNKTPDNHMETHMAFHMGAHTECRMENENINMLPISKNLNTIDSNNSRKDKETDNNKRFKAPTVDEVRAYCKERGNDVDAEHFVSYYESNGWMVGKNRMKDWMAAVRTWERNGFSNAVVTSDNAVTGATFGKLSFDPDEAMTLNLARTRRMMEDLKR
jgi:hypothetical protein